MTNDPNSIPAPTVPLPASGEVALANPTPENNEDAPDVVSSSPRYARRFAGPAGRYLLERQSIGVTRLLGAAGAGKLRVLDVGGGHLQLAPLMREMGHSVVVQGSTPASLRGVPDASSAKSGEGSIEKRIGPIRPLCATDREFDLVTCIRILGHVSRWQDLLGELCRASRRFVLVEFASDGGVQRLSRVLFGFKRRVEGDTRYFATYSLPLVVEQLDSLGFSTIAIDRQFVLPIVAHRMMNRPSISRLSEKLFKGMGLTSRLGSPVLLLAERRKAPLGADEQVWQ